MAVCTGLSVSTGNEIGEEGRGGGGAENTPTQPFAPFFHDFTISLFLMCSTDII